MQQAVLETLFEVSFYHFGIWVRIESQWFQLIFECLYEVVVFRMTESYAFK